MSNVLNSICSKVDGSAVTSQAEWASFLAANNLNATAIHTLISAPNAAARVHHSVVHFFDWLSNVEQGDNAVSIAFPWRVRHLAGNEKDIAPINPQLACLAPMYRPRDVKPKKPVGPENCFQRGRPGFVAMVPSYFKSNPYASPKEKQKAREHLMWVITTFAKGVLKQDLPDKGPNKRYRTENKRVRLLICLNRARSIDDDYNNELTEFVTREWSDGEKEQLDEVNVAVQLMGVLSQPKMLDVKNGAVYQRKTATDALWNQGRSLFNLVKVLQPEQAPRLRLWVEGELESTSPLSFRVKTQLTSVRSLLSGAICPEHFKNAEGLSPFEQAVADLRAANAKRKIVAAVLDDDACDYAYPWCHLASTDVNSALMDAQRAQKGKYRAPGIFQKVELLLRDADNKNLVLMSPGYTMGGRRCSTKLRLGVMADQAGRELLAKNFCWGVYMPEPALFRVYQPNEPLTPMDFSQAPSKEADSPGEYLPLLSNLKNDNTLSVSRTDQILFVDAAGVRTYVPDRALADSVKPETSDQHLQQAWMLAAKTRKCFQSCLSPMTLGKIIYRNFHYLNPDADQDKDLWRRLSELQDRPNYQHLSNAVTHLLGRVVSHDFFKEYDHLPCPSSAEDVAKLQEQFHQHMQNFDALRAQVLQDFENGTLYNTEAGLFLENTTDRLFNTLKEVLCEEAWSAFFWDIPMQCLTAAWTLNKVRETLVNRLAPCITRNAGVKISFGHLEHEYKEPKADTVPTKSGKPRFRGFSAMCDTDPVNEERVEVRPPPRRQSKLDRYFT